MMYEIKNVARHLVHKLIMEESRQNRALRVHEMEDVISKELEQLHNQGDITVADEDPE
jgi:hypothetical protein